MSISDRLDEIDSVAPYLDDDDMESEVLAATAALRAVLALHSELYYDGPNCSQCMYIDGDDVEPEPWPCPTVRAISAALGEGA